MESRRHRHDHQRHQQGEQRKRELGTVLHSLPPREACELLISKARQRAHNSGDNLSLAVVRVEALA